MRVYYPNGGIFFMLRWYIENDGHHLIIAPNERSLQSIAKKIFQKNLNTKIKEYYKIEIVGPPVSFSKLVEEHKLKEEILNFHREVAFNMKELSKTHPLPQQFAKCDNYVNDNKDFGSCDDWERDYHYDCKNCMESIRLVRMTPAQLHTQYYKAWNEFFPNKTHTNKEHVFSKATPAKNAQDLWYALANFGHHSSGIDLQAVDLKLMGQYHPSYLSDNVLFFFYKLGELDIAPLQLILNEYVSKKKEEAKLKEELFEKNDKLKAQKKIENIMNIFQVK